MFGKIYVWNNLGSGLKNVVIISMQSLFIKK